MLQIHSSHQKINLILTVVSIHPKALSLSLQSTKYHKNCSHSKPVESGKKRLLSQLSKKCQFLELLTATCTFEGIFWSCSISPSLLEVTWTTKGDEWYWHDERFFRPFHSRNDEKKMPCFNRFLSNKCPLWTKKKKAFANYKLSTYEEEIKHYAQREC